MMRVFTSCNRTAFLLVAFGRTETNSNFAYVDEDGAYGIRLAVDHLVSLGHKRIAYIGEPDTLFKSHQRTIGYINGLKSHNIAVDEALMFKGNFRQQSGRAGAQQLLSLPQPPTAIVAANDLMALGAINIAQEMGLAVGKDVSITGFDDIMLSAVATPSLTTIHQPAHDMGVLLCTHLVQVINGKEPTLPQTVIQPRLVERDSTGPAH